MPGDRQPLREKPPPSAEPRGGGIEQPSAGTFIQRPAYPREPTIPRAPPATAPPAPVVAAAPDDGALDLLEGIMSAAPPASSRPAVTSGRFAADLIQIEEELERLLEARRAAAYLDAGGAQLPRLRPGQLVRDLGIEVAVAFGRTLEASGILAKLILSSRERLVLEKAVERRWLISS